MALSVSVESGADVARRLNSNIVSQPMTFVQSLDDLGTLESRKLY